MLYFPPTTSIDDGTGAILCQQGYAGYHYGYNLSLFAERNTDLQLQEKSK